MPDSSVLVIMVARVSSMVRFDSTSLDFFVCIRAVVLLDIGAIFDDKRLSIDYE